MTKENMLDESEIINMCNNANIKAIENCYKYLYENNYMNKDGFDFILNTTDVFKKTTLTNLIPNDNLSRMIFGTWDDFITEVEIDIDDSARKYLLLILSKAKNKSKKVKLENEENIINTTLVNSFNDFTLTSPETDFQKYNTNLELQRLTNIVKTQDTKIKQYFEYEKTVKGKKIKIKKDGYIIASFQSPLDWIDTTYHLNTTNTMTDKEILEKVKTTKCFEITSEQEEIYNAICELIRVKIRENKSNEVFISFNELHMQLGYDGKLRSIQKEHYENLIYHMSNLHINIELNKVAYADHKEYFKLHGDIKKEPLIIWGGTYKLQAPKNKTTVKLDGFKTYLTNLMQLHFNFTNHFYISQQTKIRSKLPHASKLESYYKKKFFINTGKNNYCIDLKIETIFDILKEFNLECEYNQSSNKPQFVKRQILNPLNKMAEIKKAEILNKMVRTYFIKLD